MFDIFMVCRDGSMAKNLKSLDLLRSISLLLLVTLLLHLLSPASCVHQQTPSCLAPQKLLIEDKTRLGSTPPSCHNKCNECDPCKAVQVPTQPSHDRFQPEPGGTGTKPVELESSSPSTTAAKYANYKPLGWKCRCGSHLFNP